VSRHVAIATCQQLPDGDADDRLLARALAELGLRTSLLPWTAPGVDWAGFDATVLRSTWDYTDRRPEFLAWTASVPRLHNPAEVVAANSDKRYLAGLIEAGLPVVPTGFLAPGQPARLPDTGEYVLKPSVGAGSRGAGRFAAGQPGSAAAAGEHLRTLHEAGRTVLVQPYLAEVDLHGETAVVFIDGRYSHAARKAAMLDPGSSHPVHFAQLYVAETIAATEPSGAELELATAVLAHLSAGLDQPLLYARIDLLPSPDGPVLIEAELTEPSLFLSHHDGAAGRLAAAIRDRTA
jgi:glutathione synthase/RimK-type ligase-like ATP-grasp enzyme